jgi:hypothetical protein
VNLDEQTVFFLGYVVPIESVDEASINFGARQVNGRHADVTRRVWFGMEPLHEPTDGDRFGEA